MLVWLDGRTNTRRGRRRTSAARSWSSSRFGIGNYVEQDVYAAARVFTGWNLRRSEATAQRRSASYYEFVYNATQHDTDGQGIHVSRSIRDGNKTIPARAAGGHAGRHRLHHRAGRSSRDRASGWRAKLWNYFISERDAPDQGVRRGGRRRLSRQRTTIKAMPVMRFILSSPWFTEPALLHRATRGPPNSCRAPSRRWAGTASRSIRAITPLTNMGQLLFEPPDVAGWELGPGWFSSGAMLARMNFASTLGANQRFNLARDARRTARARRNAVLDFLLDAAVAVGFRRGRTTTLHRRTCGRRRVDRHRRAVAAEASPDSHA